MTLTLSIFPLYLFIFSIIPSFFLPPFFFLCFFLPILISFWISFYLSFFLSFFVPVQISLNLIQPFHRNILIKKIYDARCTSSCSISTLELFHFIILFEFSIIFFAYFTNSHFYSFVYLFIYWCMCLFIYFYIYLSDNLM